MKRSVSSFGKTSFGGGGLFICVGLGSLLRVDRGGIDGE